MNRIKEYIASNSVKLSLALLLGALCAFGMVDPGTALAGGVLLEAAPTDLKALEASMKAAYEKMEANLRKAQDAADKALSESQKYGGVIEAKSAETLAKVDSARLEIQNEVLTVRNQVLELAQKLGTKPQGGSGVEQKSLYEIILESEEWKSASKKAGAKSMDPIVIGSFHRFGGPRAAQITNPNPLSNDNPLVPAHRVPGIIVPAEQRLYIRDLIPQATTDQNLIEFAEELTFTNNARPQGDTSPVGHGEGEQKAESAMTFQLSNAPVVTIAHWIPASRQILADAKFLQGHISGRLLYGLKLEEEEELLTGDGGAGKLRGLNVAATAFNGGATNQTVLDTLLKAILQVSLSNYEASAFVMHPVDWFNAMLLKDTQGRYLFSDPQSMVAPRIWAKPVVATQTQTVGQFLCGAFNLAAQIWDREDANVRVSENVNDHFIRNMVAILAEERLALTIYRSAAIVKGNVSHSG